MDKFDRRHSTRQRKQATIKVLLILEDLVARNDNCDLIPAKIVNQSEDGLFLEIDRCLQPGSNVRIKMVSSEGYHPEETYYMRDGLVIRCEKFADAISRFRVGIKILRKTIQAHILTNRFR
jgi:hypothetical protein